MPRPKSYTENERVCYFCKYLYLLESNEDIPVCLYGETLPPEKISSSDEARFNEQMLQREDLESLKVYQHHGSCDEWVHF